MDQTKGPPQHARKILFFLFCSYSTYNLYVYLANNIPSINPFRASQSLSYTYRAAYLDHYSTNTISCCNLSNKGCPSSRTYQGLRNHLSSYICNRDNGIIETWLNINKPLYHFLAFLPLCTKLERGNVITSLEERNNNLISQLKNQHSHIETVRTKIQSLPSVLAIQQSYCLTNP